MCPNAQGKEGGGGPSVGQEGPLAPGPTSLAKKAGKCWQAAESMMAPSPHEAWLHTGVSQLQTHL